MTVERAREVISEARKRLGDASPETVGLPQWHSEYLSPLQDALVDTEPFSRLKFGWLFSPDGGGMMARGMVASWVIGRLRSGSTPDEIIRSAQIEIEENVCHILEVSAVFGANIKKEMRLGDGISLVPADQVRDAWRALDVQKTLSPTVFEMGDCCVLVQEVTVTPAIMERGSLEEAVDSTGVLTEPISSVRESTRELVRAAFLLSGSGGIELAARTYVAAEGRLLAVSGHRFGTLGGGHLPYTQEFEVEQVQDFFAAFLEFGEKEALLRAIDRLGRSRIDLAAADQALDLGIAAEIMLMHGSDNSNTEITHKLSTRSAWLLGTNVEDRINFARQAKELYRARSKVAHSGRLPSPAAFDRAASDRLVADLATRVLRAGKFPDWELVCMGG